MSADRLTTDPAGDVISARIQYLEEWIRDCQRYNQNVSAKLTAAEDRIRDLESLLAAKNAELRQAADRIEALEAEVAHLRASRGDVVAQRDAWRQAPGVIFGPRRKR